MAKNVKANSAEQEENLATTFPTTQRGLLLLLGVWQLAWGFFLKNFSTAIAKWLSQQAEFEAASLSSFGLVIMITGAMLLLATAYPITYRWVIFVAAGILLLSGLILWLVIFDGLQQKQLFFHLIMNYLIPVIILLLIARKNYQT
jgi:hypothetical protein